MFPWSSPLGVHKTALRVYKSIHHTKGHMEKCNMKKMETATRSRFRRLVELHHLLRLLFMAYYCSYLSSSYSRLMRLQKGPNGSLVPRPSLAAFFAAVENHAAKKAVREGLGMRLPNGG